ncbi:MAG TPA: 2-hydroxyacid dehydrogenase [Anaerolineae bacterium]|nr:2-hydroxyacid dehydrogenase [Anaerolineae bacterium]
MKILVTATLDQWGVDRLSQYGEVANEGFGDKKRLLAGRKLARALEGFDVFVTEVDQVRARVLEEVDRLQVIACCRADPVNVDVARATERGIPVLHAPGRNAQAVAELTLALMLMSLRNIPQAMDILRQEGGPQGLVKMAVTFFDLKGNEMWGKVVGIVGLGAVGSEVAKRLRGFDVELLVCDPYVTDAVLEHLGARRVDLVTLLAEADVVTLHVPLSAETKGMLGREEFRLMKPTARLVNTARAELTDEESLYETLKEGRIAGAALDVFVQEPPPPDYPLLQLPNVIATPHIGGNTYEIPVHQSRIVVSDLERLFCGERPLHIVNPSALEGFRWRDQAEEPDPGDG